MLIRVYAQIRQAQAQLRQLSQSLNQVNGAQQRGTAAAQRHEAATSRALRTGTKFGNQLQWTGRQLEYNWTLPIAVAGVAATKWALESEKAMTRVRKVYGDLDMLPEVFKNETKALEGSFKALSNFYGESRAAVIGIAADWAAAGVSGVALAKSTENTLKAMVLGEMDAVKATEALISIQSQYHLSASGLTDVLAQLNIVENQTGISMQGLIEGFTRTAGVARSAGIDTQHLAAMLAALTPAAGSAANAGNALKTIISRLLVPTNEAREVLGMMGINVADAGWQSLTAAQRLEFLSKSYSKLGGQQRAVVNATIASRWQLNKFDVLMAAMVQTNSFYYKALDATADRTKYLAQAQKELNIVLESSPQKMKQIWVILQNSAQDIIVPLIPTLIMLGQAIANLANKFAALPIEVQKFIGVALVMLAVVGPITRYLGSIATLFFTLGRAVHLVTIPFGAVVGAFTRFASVPFNAVSGGMRAIAASMANLLGRIPLAGIINQFRVALLALPMIMRGVNQLILSILIANFGQGQIRSALGGIAAGFRITFAGLIASVRVWMASLAGIVLAGLRALPGILVRFLIGPWGVAIAAVSGIIWMFRKQLSTIFGNIGQMLSEPWNAAMGNIYSSATFIDRFIQFVKNAFWSLPKEITHAMIAVVTVVQQAAMAVYKWFSYINPFARHSPSLVENVKKGVATIVNDFKGLGAIGNTINNAYKNIKRLKDLTSNFQASEKAAERKGQMANLGKVAPGAVGTFRALTNELDALQNKLDEMAPTIRAQEQVVAGWQTKLDAANSALKEQNDILDRLRETAAGYEDAISKANQTISDFSSAPLVGMGAMEDQIWANEMAQKKLRLEMLKMDEAGRTYDDIKSKIDSLNGDIEKLRATQSDLRAAGAGSDILSFYDDEIKKIESQKGALEKQAAPYAELGKALDDLQRKAEIMDLEKALKFDPLTRQIDKLANSQKELTFEEITAGIKKAQAEVAKYAPKLAEVNKQIAAQELIIKRLEAAHRVIEAAYDRENEKLARMKDAYDQVSNAMSDVGAALDDINSKIDTHLSKLKNSGLDGAGGKGLKKKIKKAKIDKLTPAGQAFMDAEGAKPFPIPGGKGAPGREGGPEDQSKLIEQYTKDLEDRLRNALGTVDIFAPLKTKWKEVTDWFNTNIKPAWQPIKDGISRIFAGVNFGSAFNTNGPIGKFVTWLTKTAWPGIKSFFVQLWWWVKTLFGDDFKVLFTETWAALKDAFADVMPELSKFFGGMKDALPILKVLGLIILGTVVVALKGLVKMLSRVLPPVIRAVGGILKGLIMVFRGVRDFVIGVFTLDIKKALGGLATIFKGAFTMAWAALRGVIEIGIGIVRGIVGTILDIIGTVFKANVSKKFADAWDGAMQKLRDFGDGAVKWIGDTFKKIGEWCSWAYDKVVGWFSKLYDKLVGHSIVPDLVKAILKCFTDLGKWLVQPLKDLYTKITDKFKQIKTWATDTWKKSWAAVKGVITSPISSAKTAIDNILGKTGVRALFTSLKNWAGDTWKKSWAAVKGVMTSPVSSAKTLIGTYLGKTGVRKVFDDLYSWFKNTWIAKSWSSVKTKIVQPLKDALTAVKDVLTGKKSIKAAFSDAVTSIGRAWDGVKEKVKSPIRFVVNTAMDNGLLRAFRSVASFVGYKAGAGFHVSLPKGFASGGSTGPGPKMKPAGIVHADEHVWTKAEVRKFPGGHSGLAKLRELVMHGRLGDAMPGYADGGAVSPVKKVTRTIISTAGKKAQSAIDGVTSKLANAISTLGTSKFAAMISKLPGKLVGSAAASLKEKAASFIKRQTKKITEIVGGGGGKNTLGGAVGSGRSGAAAAARRYGASPVSYHSDPSGYPSFDAMIGLGAGKNLRAHLVANRGKYGLRYAIHNMRIWSARNWGGRRYNPISSSGDFRHVRHVHASFANGTYGSRNGMAMVGERGPEMLRLTGGTKVINNRMLRAEMTQAFRRGLTDSSTVLEQTVVDTVSAAMARADRRIATSGRIANTAGSSGGGDTIINVDTLELPNIKSGEDAKAFIDNLKKLTSR